MKYRIKKEFTAEDQEQIDRMFKARAKCKHETSHYLAFIFAILFEPVEETCSSQVQPNRERYVRAVKCRYCGTKMDHNCVTE